MDQSLGTRQKQMTTRNFIEGLADPVQARGTDHQFSEISEIVHALKNCMSILHFWVETLVEVNRDFPALYEESIEDLRKLIDKMTSLIERLATL